MRAADLQSRVARQGDSAGDLALLVAEPSPLAAVRIQCGDANARGASVESRPFPRSESRQRGDVVGANVGDGLAQRHVHAEQHGAQRRRVRAEDLVRRFDEIRRDEQLDVSAAEMLRAAYV